MCVFVSFSEYVVECVFEYEQRICHPKTICNQILDMRASCIRNGFRLFFAVVVVIAFLFFIWHILFSVLFVPFPPTDDDEVDDQQEDN